MYCPRAKAFKISNRRGIRLPYSSTALIKILGSLVKSRKPTTLRGGQILIDHSHGSITAVGTMQIVRPATFQAIKTILPIPGLPANDHRQLFSSIQFFFPLHFYVLHRVPWINETRMMRRELVWPTSEVKLTVNEFRYRDDNPPPRNPYRATSSSSSFYFSFFSSSSSSYNDIDTYIYQLFTRLASFAGVVVVVVPAWNSQGWMDRKVLIVLGIGRCNVFWTFRETMLARDNRVANARSGRGGESAV